VAELLDSTTASVHNAHSRARATLQRERASGRLPSIGQGPTDPTAESLVRRYVEAWQSADIGKLAAVLRSDVVLTMPPLPLRYTGREAVLEFYGAISFVESDLLRCIPTRANRQPAAAVYRLDPHARVYRALGIWVLSADGDAISAFTAFVDPTLMAAFELPTEIARDSGFAFI